MNKRKDALIFLLAYKDWDEFDIKTLENPLFTTLQVGTEIKGKKIFLHADNDIDDNISKYNAFYFEQTGIYYIWKQLLNNPEWKDIKFIGQCLYRRILPISETTDFNKLFQKIDYIAVPVYCSRSIYLQFEIYHFKWVLDEIIDIILNKYPEYKNDIYKILNDNILFYSAGFIFKREDYIKYCEFIFSILEEYRIKHNLYNYDDLYMFSKKNIDKKDPNLYKNAEQYKERIVYQVPVGAFLAERIFTIFVRHNFKRYIKNIQYNNIGDVTKSYHDDLYKKEK